MITLFVKTGCPFCALALKKLEELGIPYEKKNIADEAVAKELILRGGKRQVPFIDDDDPCTTAGHHTPCLVDSDIEMYESSEIVAYLEKNYGSGTSSEKFTTTSGIRVHKNENLGTCTSGV